jgi:hypothetical protein
MDCSGIEFDPQLYGELLQRAWRNPFYTGLEVIYSNEI